MPAFAPLLRPAGGVGGLDVAVAAAALGVADGGEGVDSDVVVVGVEVGADEDVESDVVVGVEVGADDDVVAAAMDVDHVVAERSDLWECSRSVSTLVCSILSDKLKGCYRFKGGGKKV